MNAIVANLHSVSFSFLNRAWDKFVAWSVNYGESRARSILKQHWNYLDPMTKAELLKDRKDLDWLK